jgi:hypothetical protein
MTTATATNQPSECAHVPCRCPALPGQVLLQCLQAIGQNDVEITCQFNHGICPLTVWRTEVCRYAGRIRIDEGEPGRADVPDHALAVFNSLARLPCNVGNVPGKYPNSPDSSGAAPITTPPLLTRLTRARCRSQASTIIALTHLVRTLSARRSRPESIGLAILRRDGNKVLPQ